MKRQIKLFMVMVVLMSLVACANFKNNTYKAIGVAGVTYDTSMKAAADLKKKAMISDKQWAELEKIAKGFYVVYQSTIDTFEVYLKVETVEQKERVKAILKEMELQLPKVVAYIELLKGGVK